MSIPLPIAPGGSILSDYAASSTNINRIIQNVDGVMTPIFSCQMSFQRTDYLVNDQGVKIGIVSMDTGPNLTGNGMNTNRYGNISIDPAKLNAMFAKDPKFLESFLYVSEVEDKLIEEQLIAEGILPKPVVP